MDSYDPEGRQLTVQTVTVGTATLHNAVVSAQDLVMIGSVSGADVYNGSALDIAYAEVGGTIFKNVEVSVGAVIGVAGAMPTLAIDTYNGASHQLQIPAVQVVGQDYTNVTITLGTLVSVAGTYSAAAEPFLYSFSGDGGVAGSTDGDDPVAGPIEGSDGNLYGVTNLGGAYSRGALYRISLQVAETVLHSFGGADNGLGGNGDGAQTLGNLLQGSNGNFYGMTSQGGAHGVGSIFMLTIAVPAR